MNISNRNAYKGLTLVFCALLFAFGGPISALADAFERYEVGGTAVIGEFVYDDEMVATTTAGCTVDIYNPAGSLIVNNGSMTPDASGWYSYDYSIPGAGPQGLWPVEMTCGSIGGGDLVKTDKSFVVGDVITSSSTIAGAVWNNATRTITSATNIASDIWGATTRTLTAFGSLAADVWNGSYASTRRLTDSTLTGGGTIATDSTVSSAITTASTSIVANINTTINNASSSLSAQILNNTTLIQALNDISAADVWAYGARTLSGDVSLNSASIDAIWDTASAGLTSAGSIGKLLADNIDAQISTRGTSNLTANDVWTAATRTLTDYSTSTIASAIWNSATRTLTNNGNDITAADVWNVLSSTLNTVGTVGYDVLNSSGGGASLNDIAALIQNATSTIIATINNASTSVVANINTEVLANRTLINALNDITAAEVWAYGSRSLSSGADLSASAVTSIWDKAASSLTSSGSVGKLLVDNIDATISSRGISNLTANDVWTAGTRTLTDYSTSSVATAAATAVWANGARTLTNYGNDITAGDVWNVLTSSLTTANTIGKRLTDNVDTSISGVVTSINSTINNASTSIVANINSAISNASSSLSAQILNNTSLIQALNDITAEEVWLAGTRTLTGGVDLSSAGVTAIWDKATSALTTSGSIGKRLVDNIDAQISTRGTSNLTANDIWTAGTRTLTDYSTSSIATAAATAVWANGARTLTNYGNDITAADVWNVLTSSLTTANTIGKRLTDNVDTTISGVVTSLNTTINNASSSLSAQIQNNTTLINALNDISAAEVWAVGSRTLTGGVDIGSSSIDSIWNKASSALTTSGSIGKRLVDNIDATISSRGISNLTANDVWSATTRTLSDYATTSISSAVAGAVWSNGTRTLTNYGNDITAADVWNVLSSSLTTVGTIGNELSGLDTAISNASSSIVSSLNTTINNASSSIVAEIQLNRTLINALNDISADDVWLASTRTLTGGVDIGSSSIDSIWNKASSALTTSGSIGKRLVDNIDAQISTRGTSNLTANDVWNATTRTLTDYATTSLSSAITASVWSNAARTLTNYGNDITASDVWNVLSSALTTVGTVGYEVVNMPEGATLADITGLINTATSTIISNLTSTINNASSSLSAQIQANKTLIQSLNNISADDVWLASTRTLTTGADLSSSAITAIWDKAASSLTTSGSIGKRLADNIDAQISTRGTSNITAADVWTSATRTLSDYSTSSITSAVWNSASRTLSNYGNDITAVDVWNVLSSSLTTANTIGKRLVDNVDTSISGAVTSISNTINNASTSIVANVGTSINNASSSLSAQILTNRTLIQSLNNISAADVWTYGARGINQAVDLSSTSLTAIWDKAASSLTTSGSIGKLLVDNIDATISSRGISNLTATDVWSAATRTLTEYASSSEASTIADAVWSNSTRTLTNYGNNITAADVWNVLSSSLTTVGSIGEQVATNLDETISSRASLISQQDQWTVRMTNTDSVSAGYTYRTKLTILDYSSQHASPFSVPVVTVYDADRNIVVSSVPMTLLSTGVYEYTYSVNNAAAQGQWETVIQTQVESGKTITTNDYWSVAGSPAQVLINSVDTSLAPTISANITITNEGLTSYEYQYEWCIVSSVNNNCGGGDDVYHATAAKLIDPGEDWNTTVNGTITSNGDYYFKLVVYFGTDQSSASRTFTVSSLDEGSSGGGGGGGGGGSSGSTTNTATVANAITTGPCVGADLNGDGKVGSTDFSILLFYWKGVPPFKNTCVDMNGDNLVNTIDFSIMLSQWGGKGIAIKK